jgi:hypothetical protein
VREAGEKVASNQQALNAKQTKEVCQAKEDDQKLKHTDLGMMTGKSSGSRLGFTLNPTSLGGDRASS